MAIELTGKKEFVHKQLESTSNKQPNSHNNYKYVNGVERTVAECTDPACKCRKKKFEYTSI